MQGRRVSRRRNLLRGQRTAGVPLPPRDPLARLLPPAPSPAAGRPAPPRQTRHARPRAPRPGARLPVNHTRRTPQSWFQRGTRAAPPTFPEPAPPRAPRGSRSASPSPGSENGGVRLPGAKSESLPRRKPPGDAAGGRRGEVKLPPDGPSGGNAGGQSRASRWPSRSRAAAATAVPSAPLFPFQEDPREAEPGNQEVPGATPPAAAMETAPPPGRPARDPASAQPPRPPARLTGRRRTPPPRPRLPPSWRPLPGGRSRPAFPPPGARPAPRGRRGKPGAEPRTRALKGEGGAGDPGGAAGTGSLNLRSRGRSRDGGTSGRSTEESPRAGSLRPDCPGFHF